MVKVRCLGLQDDNIANFKLVSLGDPSDPSVGEDQWALGTPPTHGN